MRAAEAGSSVALRDGQTVLGTATAGPDGAWAVDVVQSGQSPHLLTATAKDAAGNTGGPASPVSPYTLDTQAPAVTAALSNDDGVSSTDAITSDAGLSGTGDPDATVTILDGSTVLATAMADNQGCWSVPGSGLGLADGDYALTVCGTDAAGNIAADAVGLRGGTNDAALAVSGSWGGENGGTDILSVTVNGATCTAGLSPELQVDGAAWVLHLPAPLADGAYDVAAQAVRAGGGSAHAAAHGALTVDTVAPAVGVGLTQHSNAFDTVGIVRTEALTGTGTPGATLRVTGRT